MQNLSWNKDWIFLSKKFSFCLKIFLQAIHANKFLFLHHSSFNYFAWFNFKKKCKKNFHSHRWESVNKKYFYNCILYNNIAFCSAIHIDGNQLAKKFMFRLHSISKKVLKKISHRWESVSKKFICIYVPLAFNFWKKFLKKISILIDFMNRLSNQIAFYRKRNPAEMECDIKLFASKFTTLILIKDPTTILLKNLRQIFIIWLSIKGM